MTGRVGSGVWRGWRWVAAGGSGVLVGLCYPPFEVVWLVWVGLVPLLGAVWLGEEGAGGRGEGGGGGTQSGWGRCLGVFGMGWVAGAVGFGMSLQWISEVSVAGWLLLAGYCGVYPGLWAVFVAGPGRPGAFGGWGRGAWVGSLGNLVSAVVAAAGWVGLEWVRGVLFSGFGWNGLGVALWEQVALIQVADFAGVGGVSFLVVLVNVVLLQTVVRLVLEVRAGRARPHYDFAVVLGVCALAFVYGVGRLGEGAGDVVRLRVAAVQPNVPQEQKWDPAYEEEILGRFWRLSEAGILFEPDLLVWPEAATPRAALVDERSRGLVMAVASAWEGDFLLGTVHFAPEGDFNSALLVADGGERLELYHKMHLVPFGEFVPFRESFPVFAWIVGDLVPEDFDAGKEPVVFGLSRKPVRVAPLICFEDTLGELARRFVARGATLFVVVTNDGWFGESAGSRQHLAQSVFRCVENRLPMLRAANTGVTCWVDAAGRVRSVLATPEGNTFIEGVLTGEFEVPVSAAGTFYSRHGEVFSKVCVGVAVCGVLGWVVWGRRARRS